MPPQTPPPPPHSQRSGLSPTRDKQKLQTATRVLGSYSPWEGAAGGGVRVGGGVARSPTTKLGATLSPETRANLSYHMIPLSPISGIRASTPNSFPSLDDEFKARTAAQDGVELALQAQRDAIGATFT